jgi:hypothetical protein
LGQKATKEIAMPPCEKRDRLNSAYEQALQEKYALESELSPQLASHNPELVKQAKKQLERAMRHPTHLLMQLLKHEREHRCR